MEFSRKKAPACIGPLKLSTFVCEIAQINEGVEKISVFSREINKLIATGGGSKMPELISNVVIVRNTYLSL